MAHRLVLHTTDEPQLFQQRTGRIISIVSSSEQHGIRLFKYRSAPPRPMLHVRIPSGGHPVQLQCPGPSPEQPVRRPSSKSLQRPARSSFPPHRIWSALQISASSGHIPHPSHQRHGSSSPAVCLSGKNCKYIFGILYRNCRSSKRGVSIGKIFIYSQYLINMRKLTGGAQKSQCHPKERSYVSPAESALTSTCSSSRVRSFSEMPDHILFSFCIRSRQLVVCRIQCRWSQWSVRCPRPGSLRSSGKRPFHLKT